MKIAINGFGRLGRAIARAALKQGVEIVGINDIAHSENLAYVFEKDSQHGALGGDVCYANNALIITPHTHDIPTPIIAPRATHAALESTHIRESTLESTQKNFTQIDSTQRDSIKSPITIPLFSCANPKDLDFGALGADVVIESSGLFLRTQDIDHHITKGVKRVIISAPATDDTPTFVLGVNHTAYKGEQIISNASCTTNCLAPIAMLLEREFGIEKATLSTIHSYTNDQNLLDVAHRSDKRRSRAAALNIIPTSTGAAKALYKILPSLKDKIHGHSLRVPVADVSMLDLNAFLQKSVRECEINALFEAESNGALKGILGVDKRFGVSSDFLNDTHSAIVAQDLTFCLDRACKIMAWYDNEWGYAHRILDIARYIL